MRQYFDWQTLPKQPSGESLPLLPGIKNQKQFSEQYGITKNLRREYLNARSQLAGYASYREWEKRRTEEGTKRIPGKREPDKKFKTGELYVFDFTKDSKTGITIPNQKQYQLFAQMDKLIRAIPDRYYIQIHYLAHTYAKMNEDRPINEWGWGSTPLIDMEVFREKDFSSVGHSMLNFFYQYIGVRPYTFPDDKEDFPDEYSWRMHGKQILGFREIHITIWKQPGENHK